MQMRTQTFFNPNLCYWAYKHETKINTLVNLFSFNTYELLSYH